MVTKCSLAWQNIVWKELTKYSLALEVTWYNRVYRLVFAITNLTRMD